MSPVVGAPLDRVDGRAKVTGQARYAADQPVPNLAHGVLVTSRIASGRITHIDTRAAEAAPGVLAVITHRNAPRFPTPASDKTSWFGQSFVPLQGEAIHHSGQIVAFVVAETLEQAHHAAGLVEIDYQANKPEVSVTGKLGEAFVPQPNRAGRYEYGRGQPDGALAGARPGYAQPSQPRCSTTIRWSPPRPRRSGTVRG